MITKNMIDAGCKAYKGKVYDDLYMTSLVTAIYEAMTLQRQKDAMIAYQTGDLAHGHSSR